MTSHGNELGPLVDHREDGRAALRMIRETIETYGGPGILPPETLTPGPRMVDEAAVLCAAIIMLVTPQDELDQIRAQLDAFDTIEEIRPEMRVLITRLWPDMVAKLPPE